MFKKLMMALGVLALAGVLSVTVAGESSACGANSVCGPWGAPGGGDFAPGGFNAPQRFSGDKQISQDQARQIVSRFIGRLKGNLTIGRIEDKGRYYEVEILTENKKVFDRLAVDKSTGLIRPLS